MKPKTKQPKRLNSPSRQSSWDQRFKELKAFKKTHGHCKVPYEYPPNLALARWVSNIRHAKKHGKLAEERVRRLDALVFSWEREVPWEQRIHDLKAFKKKHGHCNVPHKYQPNPALGRWVDRVRKARKQCKLTEERVRRLDAIGFCWVRRPPKVPWKQRINDLKAFKKEYGHCNVPYRYPPNPALGEWVANVRRRKKRGTLTEDKILSLNALGFVWEGLKKGRPLENASKTCVPSKTRRSR